MTPLTPRRRKGVLPAVGLALALTLGASACSGDEEPSAPSGAPTEASEGDAPVELEEDGLPAAFPREDVPVVDGDVVSVSEPNDGNNAYTVLVSFDGTPAEAVGAAVDQLESAGWEASTEITGEPPVPQVLSKSGGEARRVILTNTPQQELTNLTYSISVTN